MRFIIDTNKGLSVMHLILFLYQILPKHDINLCLFLIHPNNMDYL